MAGRLMPGGSGAVFGFAVESSLPLAFLRPGQGTETLHVDEAPGESLAHRSAPIRDWKFKDAKGDVSARLYRGDGVLHFWTTDSGWFRIDVGARRLTVSEESREPRRELRLWGVPAMLCAVDRGEVMLHAAAVEIDGAAVLLAAPGQHGKTTLALAFHTSGFRVLSEDTSCVTLGPSPMLLPGPASLRVRPDMYAGSAPDGTELVAQEPDRVFLRLSTERSGPATGVPIRAIVFLHRSPDDEETRLERADPVRSLPDLFTLNFRLVGRESTAESFARVSRLATTASMWHLHRPLRRDVMDAVIGRIVDAAGVRSG